MATKKKTVKKSSSKKAPSKKKAPAKKSAVQKAEMYFDVILTEGKKIKTISYTDTKEFISFLTEHLFDAMKGKTKALISEVSIPGELEKKADAAIHKILTKLAKVYDAVLSQTH